MRWISLEVEKPPYGKTVLVWARSGYVTVRALRARKYTLGDSVVYREEWEAGGLPIESSSHWMPLPAAPDGASGWPLWLIESNLMGGIYTILATDWDTHGESHAG